MMKRDEVIAILAANQEQLQEMRVKSLELFGSVARDEARPDRYFTVVETFHRNVSTFPIKLLGVGCIIIFDFILLSGVIPGYITALGINRGSHL